MVQLLMIPRAQGSSAESDPATSNAPKMGSNAVKTSKQSAPLPGGSPNFVWSEIFDIYFPADGATPTAIDAESRAQWKDVWRILVDRESGLWQQAAAASADVLRRAESLFAPPSHALKATGFSLLSLAMQRLPPTEVPALFGEGVIRTFSNHLRKTGGEHNEKTLSRVADKLAASLPPFMAANPSVALPLLKALVGPPHGSHAFDHKKIEKMVAKLDLKACKGWTKWLKDFVLAGGPGDDKAKEDDGTFSLDADEEKAMNPRRLWACDQLLHVVKTTAVAKDDELIADLLEFFAVLGWFDVKKAGKGAVSRVALITLIAL